MFRARFLFVSLLALFLSMPQGLFAASNQPAGETPTYTLFHAKARIKRKLPNYRFHNVQLFRDKAVFFAFHKTNETIPFRWYELDLKKSYARPKRVLASAEFSLIFQVAFSPDRSEVFVTSRTGEVFAIDLRTNKKTSLGVFTSTYPSGEFPTYTYPAYSPDGKYILLHNPWENLLLVVSAKEKDIGKGIPVRGFWITPQGGGESPRSGSDIKIYEFSRDFSRVTFNGTQILNLNTLAKEQP